VRRKRRHPKDLIGRVRFFWSELHIGDHGDGSATPLATATSRRTSITYVLPGTAAPSLLARAFWAISLKKKRTLIGLARRSPSGSGLVLSRQERAEAVNAHLYATTGRVSNTHDAHVGVARGVPPGAADRAGQHGMDPTSVEGAGRRVPASLDDHEGCLAVGAVDRAVSMLLVHVAGVDGHCAGCVDRCRFALAPCPVARWARLVVETHGVAVWDARPAASVDGECGGASLTPLDAGGASPLSRAAV
jgi:hypothetical protein